MILFKCWKCQHIKAKEKLKKISYDDKKLCIKLIVIIEADEENFICVELFEVKE